MEAGAERVETIEAVFSTQRRGGAKISAEKRNAEEGNNTGPGRSGSQRDHSWNYCGGD
jgi:hypothetical protein